MPLSQTALIELCRVLRHYLSAGLTVVDVFRKQADQGMVELRPVAQRLFVQVNQGSSLGAALEAEPAIPPLMVSLIRVGEQTGMPSLL
ncbi:MAG: type II secretion system F family protein, partial [Gemmataceae bacterium]